MKKKTWMRWMSLALSAVMLAGCSGKPAPEETEAPTEETAEPTVQAEPTAPERLGYRDAITYEDGFLVVGTEGRIDFITNDGQVEKRGSGTTATLSGMYNDDGYVMICAEDGTVLGSPDGINYTISKVGDEKLLGITVYNNTAFTVSDQGTVYSSHDLVEWEATRFNGVDSAVGIASDDQCVVVVSEDTDILVSLDGENWDYQNYNEVYEGLSYSYGFRRVVGAGATFFILGYYLDNPNIPALLYSETGEVLMEKALLEINGEAPTGEKPIVPNDLGIDIDQLYAPCEDGSVLTVTSCVVCNELQQMEKVPLNAIALNEQIVLLVGEDYFFSLQDHEVLRQDRIKAEQALFDLENNGAILVDVREDEELIADGYIPGSLHIPLADVEEKLPELVPNQDNELIFYCAAGKRAQTAAGIAQELGYYNVYNLGGLSDWPYDIVEGENP